jgi:putative IMPACT (imprinted ancient) family translation regulator
MKLLSTSFIEEKKSKFYGYLYELDDIKEIDNLLSELKKNNKGYRHLPYAYLINSKASKSNDKEPGNIGLELYNILYRNNLSHHLLAVIRYYGGSKLGAPLLFRTYLKTANNSIKTLK